MKLLKTASGKSSIKLSKKEWKDIGIKHGWVKISQDNHTKVIQNPLKKSISVDREVNDYDSEVVSVDAWVHYTINGLNIDNMGFKAYNGINVTSIDIEESEVGDGPYATTLIKEQTLYVTDNIVEDGIGVSFSGSVSDLIDDIDDYLSSMGYEKV